MNEYLTPDESAELIALLHSTHTELDALVSSFAEGAATVDLDEPIGRLSRMDAMQQQQMSAANKRTTELRIKLIAQALKSVERGDYGICRRCEEPIGYARLKARPEASLCVDCQTGAERR